MSSRKSLFLEGVSTLTGTIIGAGVLGLPYVFYLSGYLPVYFLMLIGFSICLSINLMLAELTLRTHEKHQIPGYIEKFLPKYKKLGKYLVISSMICGIYGAILAYLVAQSNAFYYLFGVNKILVATIITSLVFLIVLFDIKYVEDLEPVFSTIVYSLLIGCPLYLFFTHHINTSILFKFNPKYLMLAFSTTIFSFMGSAAIPEVREELERDLKMMKKVVLTGMIIPLVLYTIFTLSVCLTNSHVPRVATYLFGPIGYVLTIVITLCPFLTLSLALKETFEYDCKLPRWLAQMLVFLPPYLILVLFNANVSIFTKALGLVGSLTALLYAVPVLIAHSNSKKTADRKPEFEITIPKPIKVIIVLLLAIATVSNIIYVLFI